MNFKSVLSGVLLAFGFGTVAFAADVKFGFVYVGPVGDYGWTYEHNEGRLAVEEHFGDRVETIYQESVAVSIPKTVKRFHLHAIMIH